MMDGKSVFASVVVSVVRPTCPRSLLFSSSGLPAKFALLRPPIMQSLSLLAPPTCFLCFLPLPLSLPPGCDCNAAEC